jgi:hypothetical protein
MVASFVEGMLWFKSVWRSVAIVGLVAKLTTHVTPRLLFCFSCIKPKRTNEMWNSAISRISCDALVWWTASGWLAVHESYYALFTCDLL